MDDYVRKNYLKKPQHELYKLFRASIGWQSLRDEYPTWRQAKEQ
jgi:hypothetical protein